MIFSCKLAPNHPTRNPQYPRLTYGQRSAHTTDIRLGKHGPRGELSFPAAGVVDAARVSQVQQGGLCNVLKTISFVFLALLQDVHFSDDLIFKHFKDEHEF